MSSGLVYTYWYDKKGDMYKYIFDLDNNEKWKVDLVSYEWINCTYKGSADPLMVLFFPYGIIAYLFFGGAPAWMWGVKEVERKNSKHYRRLMCSGIKNQNR